MERGVFRDKSGASYLFGIVCAAGARQPQKISFTSAEGQGSTFWVDLPVQDKD